MAEKKEKANKPRIEIQTRKPEKRGIFANIGNDRSSDPHPLREILNFQTDDNLDVQHIKSADVQQNNLLDVQTPKNQASNNLQIGRPNVENLDVQQKTTGTSNTDNIGRPNLKTLDALTPEKNNWTSKSNPKLDAKTPVPESLDVQRSTDKADRKKYENNRNTARLSLRPNSEILRKFKVFCVQKDLGMTEFFEISGLRFIDLDVQSQTDLDVLTPLDDRRLKMMFKCKPFIINLYLAYNSIFNELSATEGKKWSARWSPRDDESAHRYNEVPPQIVELGILQTQINKGFGQSRIQTFKYYTDEIEKVLMSGVSDEMLDNILQYHRNIWKNLTKREVDLGFLESGNQNNGQYRSD